MNEQNTQDVQPKHSTNSESGILNLLQISGAEMLLLTIVFGLLGAIIYAGVSMVPMPYTMVSLFKFGLLPSIAVIAVTGAIRGPVAGFLSGYLGVILYDLLSYGVIVMLTLPAMAFGVTGLIVGMARYEFDNGRSLAKLSVLSVIGFVFTTLLVVVVGLFLEEVATLVEIGFVMLPMLTQGLPSIFVLTPLLAATWHMTMSRIAPSVLKK